MTDINLAEPSKINILEEKKSIIIIGCVYYGDPFHSKAGWDYENEIGLLWKRFMKLFEKHKDLIRKYQVNPHMAYEIHIQPDDYKKTKKFYVYVGIEVSKLKELPLEMYSKILPTTMYAIFTFKGKDIFKGGHFIWQEWLPKSKKYDEAYPYFIEAYDEHRFFGLENEKTEIDYYVPIKLKKKNGRRKNEK